MKKVIILFLIVLMVLVSAIFWFLSEGSNAGFTDNLHFLIILLIVGFAVFIGFRRLGSAKRREPAEDELTKKVLLKTAAWSYYISLYWWVFLLFIKDRIEIDAELLLGTGILGMAVAFALSWLIIYFRGAIND